MPIQYVEGDLLVSGAQVLVIPVNCQGVAGKGLAKKCRGKYPHWFSEYQIDCQNGWLGIGRVTVYEGIHENRYICLLNFPTKDGWRQGSMLDYIERGLVDVVDTLEHHMMFVESVAFPKLGCGAGGLLWEDVQPLMERYLSRLSCRVYVYI